MRAAGLPNGYVGIIRNDTGGIKWYCPHHHTRLIDAENCATRRLGEGDVPEPVFRPPEDAWGRAITASCIGCLDPVKAGEPTCGAVACLRIFRFAERTAGPDPDQDVWDYLDGKPYVPVSGLTHRHPEGGGWREHNHAAGSAPHQHDPDTGFQVPTATITLAMLNEALMQTGMPDEGPAVWAQLRAGGLR